MKKRLYLLGIRGLPARHGGFETFAEYLCDHLVAAGWDVTVYCQNEEGKSFEDSLRGFKRVHIPTKSSGALATGEFDFKAICHAHKQQPGVWLTLGYNTGAFNVLPRFWRHPQAINMDGIEWKRDKWSGAFKAALFINHHFAARAGNVLIADHPKITDHLAETVSRDKIIMIPYGSPKIIQSDTELIAPYDLQPNQYSIVIARPEPENNLLPIVKGWSRRKRDHKLVILGNYRETDPYHRAVREASSDEIVFPGAMYDPKIVQALRFYARLYIHGHSVGGTNPSLVEALGAGNPVFAHDNVFNRWVAGKAGRYWADAYELDALLIEVLHDLSALAPLQEAAVQRHTEAFEWPAILKQYEDMLDGLWQKIPAGHE